MDVDLQVRGVIETLRLRDGDRILVTVDQVLTMEQSAVLREKVQQWIGADTPVLVVGKGVEFQVAGRAEEPAVG